MKRILLKIGAGVVLLLGISLLAYPAVASYVQQRNNSRVIGEMEKQLQRSGDETVELQHNLAQWYNLNLTAEQPEEDFEDSYDDILDYSEHVMGYIVIPAIGERQPIYHGASDEVLSKGIGHVPESAFPVGGEGNHTVLLGNPNAPGTESFSDLGQLETGDLFYIHVLGEILAYRVGEIQRDCKAQPEYIAAVPGEDLCTLVMYTTRNAASSCLLVRGERTDSMDQKTVIAVEEDTQKLEWVGIGISVVLLAGFVPLLFLGLLKDGTSKE